MKLHAQEIRNCVVRGPFRDLIQEMASNPDFRAVVRLPDNEVQQATYEELVLRFFAFYDRYTKFDHDVGQFLTSYMQEHAKIGPSQAALDAFGPTMAKLKEVLTKGISRNNRTTTPINLYEGIAVGSALALTTSTNLQWDQLSITMESDAMKKFTTGATNSKAMVKGRIELTRDALVG